MVDYEERERVREIRRRHMESLRAGATNQVAGVVVEVEDPKLKDVKAGKNPAGKSKGGKSKDEDDLDSLRVRYKLLSGSVASPKWDAEELSTRIAALDAASGSEGSGEGAASTPASEGSSDGASAPQGEAAGSEAAGSEAAGE